MNWTDLIKKIIGLDVIFGAKSKKLAGINDAAFIITTDIVLDTVDDSITFTNNDMPEWVQKDRYFRVFGGLNDDILYRVKEVVSSNKIEVYENIITDVGNYTLDARLWQVHNDNTITRKSPTGGTMYNLDNLNNTGIEGDGSYLAKVPVVHYHNNDPWKVNVIPIGEKNNQNLIFILPDNEVFVDGKLEVYLSGLHLNGNQNDPERDFEYLPDRTGFVILIEPNKYWRLNTPPMQFESLEITYLQDLQ